MIYRLLNSKWNLFNALNRTKIVVLGNQKSGTSIIAYLLAKSMGVSVLLDSPLIWQPNLNLLQKNRSLLKDVIQKNRFYFGRGVVKEPNLTFFAKELMQIYPSKTKYIFIVRDPRDNIRSQLNRINVQGDLMDLEELKTKFSIHEEYLFDKLAWGFNSEHYIGKLAERWNLATNIYFKNQDIIKLVKYEDFMENKIQFIEQIVKSLGYIPKNNISHEIDKQLQPKGNVNISWKEFFGNNVELVTSICKINMEKLGYFE